LTRAEKLYDELNIFSREIVRASGCPFSKERTLQHIPLHIQKGEVVAGKLVGRVDAERLEPGLPGLIVASGKEIGIAQVVEDPCLAR